MKAVIGLLSHMPVRGLPSLAADLKDGVFNRISLREYAQSRGVENGHRTARVVVDGIALLYFILSKTEWSFGGEGDAIRHATLQFCSSLYDIGLRILVLFDGVISHSNYQGGLRKSAERLKKISQVVQMFRPQPFRHIPRHTVAPCIPPMAQEIVMEALHSAGVPIRVCETECARCVHWAAITSNVMLIGYDSNYLCTTAPGYIHCDSLSKTKDGDMVANLVVPSRFAEALGLLPSRLTLLSCLLGNEVAPEWAFQRFHRTLVAPQRQEDRREVVAATANWLAQQPPERSNDAIYEDVVELILRESEDGPGVHIDVDELTYSNFVQATLEQKRELLYILYNRSNELLTPKPLHAQLGGHFPFFEQATGVTGLSGLSDAYFRGDFPATLFSVLLNGIVWMRPCIEDTQQPAASAVGAPVRAASYAALFSDGTGATPELMERNNLVIQESFHEQLRTMLHPVSPMWVLPSGRSMPSWQSIHALSQQERRLLLLDACQLCSPEQIEVFNQLPESWEFVGLSLVTFFNGTRADTWELLGLIESIVAPAHHAQLYRLHKEAQLGRDPSDFHRFAQWQHSVQSVLMLNAALGFPIPAGTSLAKLNAVNPGQDPSRRTEHPCLAALFNGMAHCYARAEARQGRSLLARNSSYLASGQPVAQQTSQRRRGREKLTPAVIDILERARLLLRVVFSENTNSSSPSSVVASPPSQEKVTSIFSYLVADDEEPQEEPQAEEE